MNLPRSTFLYLDIYLDIDLLLSTAPRTSIDLLFSTRNRFELRIMKPLLQDPMIYAVLFMCRNRI